MTRAAKLAVGLVLVGACASPELRVRHFGAMREVMMEGKTEARAALSPYERRGWYGVGALAGLAGEVLIEDGCVWTTRDRADALEEQAGAAQATLLTVAEVRRWREAPLAEAADLPAIERAVAAAVPATLAEGAAPVPFLVEGEVEALDLHVVRGACPHGVSDPRNAPDRWSSATVAGAKRVSIVGFFAPGRAGVMTHHGTAIHAHALVLAGSRRAAMGHVDRLVLGPGARLRVPAD